MARRPLPEGWDHRPCSVLIGEAHAVGARLVRRGGHAVAVAVPGVAGLFVVFVEDVPRPEGGLPVPVLWPEAEAGVGQPVARNDRRGAGAVEIAAVAVVGLDPQIVVRRR